MGMSSMVTSIDRLGSPTGAGAVHAKASENPLVAPSKQSSTIVYVTPSAAPKVPLSSDVIGLSENPRHALGSHAPPSSSTTRSRSAPRPVSDTVTGSDAPATNVYAYSGPL